MKFKTKILVCQDCGEEFVFTADAQEWNAQRGYRDNPQRCKACHIEYLKKISASPNKRQKAVGPSAAMGI